MPTVDPENRLNAEIARELYVSSADAEAEAEDWAVSLAKVRERVEATLTASHELSDLQAALQSDGSHMLVFRHLLAPPKSQDQFALLCPVWSKSSEKSGRALPADQSASIASTLRMWLDKRIAPWLADKRLPTAIEREILIERIISFIAPKMTETEKRNRLSALQETQVIDLLIGLGWTKLPSATIDTRAAIPPRSFMHKTRFATATTTAQEVDIACGLAQTFVAAMECKVTNDATNSVKRINDILKKSNAWKAHWGNFVETAALLQGVVKAEDVQRLSDEGVRVFWSHDLKAFSDWVESRV